MYILLLIYENYRTLNYFSWLMLLIVSTLFPEPFLKCKGGEDPATAWHLLQFGWSILHTIILFKRLYPRICVEKELRVKLPTPNALLSRLGHFLHQNPVHFHVLELKYFYKHAEFKFENVALRNKLAVFLQTAILSHCLTTRIDEYTLLWY